jgi:hypothetical protein
VEHRVEGGVQRRRRRRRRRRKGGGRWGGGHVVHETLRIIKGIGTHSSES